MDRKVAEEALTIAPEAREAGLSNRAFIRLVVHRMAAEAGIRQFLDLGSGLPTQGNVHEIARSVDPGLVPPADWRPEPEDVIPRA